MSIWSKLFRGSSRAIAGQVNPPTTGQTGRRSLDLPPEFEHGDGTVHLNAVFANNSRERLIAICREMPIEHLDFSQPGASDAMNRAATVSLFLVRYLAAKDKPKEYGDLVIPRFLDQLDRYSSVGIHAEVAAQLEHFGIELMNGGQLKEAVRCFALLEGTLYGQLIGDRVSEYTFAALNNIAMATKSKDDVAAAVGASQKLSPQAKQQFAGVISRLNGLQ